jgi:hypothetical protein
MHFKMSLPFGAKRILKIRFIKIDHVFVNVDLRNAGV